MARLCTLLLGSVQFILDGKPLTDFDSDKVRALLIYLMSEPSQEHRRDSLVGLFWGDQPEEPARHSLRQALFSLRNILGDRSSSSPFLLVSREHIGFNQASDHWLDTSAFSSTIEICRRHEHQDLKTCIACLDRMRQASQLYAGNLLEPFFLPGSPAFEEWVTIRREHLRHQGQQVLFDLSEAYRERGEYDQAVRFAQRQLELEPPREEAHFQLIRLYAEHGHRSAALIQYETCRRILKDELGVEPSDETQRLLEKVVSAEPSPLFPRNHIPQRQLLHTTSRFVGRTTELNLLRAQLEDGNCRLITLTGPGGVGKTRLAMEAVSHNTGMSPNGVFFIPLAGIDSIDSMLAVTAECLGLRVPETQVSKRQLLSHLGEKELLLILDDLDQLVPKMDLLSEILRQCPRVKILGTSRERLNLEAEWVFPIQGLGLEDTEADVNSAIELFVQHARRIRPGFAPSDRDRADIIRLCRAVDGLPLAIGMAAAWIGVLSCADIAQQVEADADLLKSPLRDLPERHHSMRAVFDQSWKSLNEEEQHVFKRLAEFPGSFDWSLARKAAYASVDVLKSLVDKSLMCTTVDGHFRLHELFRRFGLEKSKSTAQAIEPPPLPIGFSSITLLLYCFGWLLTSFFQAADLEFLAAVL